MDLDFGLGTLPTREALFFILKLAAGKLAWVLPFWSLCVKLYALAAVTLACAYAAAELGRFLSASNRPTLWACASRAVNELKAAPGFYVAFACTLVVGVWAYAFYVIIFFPLFALRLVALWVRFAYTVVFKRSWTPGFPPLDNDFPLKFLISAGDVIRMGWALPSLWAYLTFACSVAIIWQASPAPHNFWAEFAKSWLFIICLSVPYWYFCFLRLVAVWITELFGHPVWARKAFWAWPQILFRGVWTRIKYGVCGRYIGLCQSLQNPPLRFKVIRGRVMFGDRQPPAIQCLCR